MRTNFGAFVSIVILIIVTIYGIKKGNILMKRADSVNSDFIETDGVSKTTNFGFDDTEFFPAFKLEGWTN